MRHVVKMWYISLMVMKVHRQFQTRLQAEGLGILLQFWVRTKDLSSPCPGPVQGPSQHHILRAPCSFPSGKADHSPRFRTQVKNKGSSKSLPPHGFRT